MSDCEIFVCSILHICVLGFTKQFVLAQIGRESPADIIVAVPTVSTRHAMLRLGKELTQSLSSLTLLVVSPVWSFGVTTPRIFCICAENNRVSVTDLSSTNGTYVDDEELVPLRAIEMSVGAEVTFGNHHACT